MKRERVPYLLTALAATLAAAAHLTNGAAQGAAAAVGIGAAWLAAWRRGSYTLIDLGLAALLATAALGGGAAAIGAAGAALAAWDAMRAERTQRAFAQAEIRAEIGRTRARYALLAAGGGTIIGLLTFIARAVVPAGFLSFGALAALLLVSVLVVTAAVRAITTDRRRDP